jgi:hypothetical protein
MRTITTSDTDTDAISKLFRTSIKLDSVDRRLAVRCQKILDILLTSPESSFPQAYKENKHQLKLLYRFFSNPRVKDEEIFKAGLQDTLEKVDLLDDLIIVAQDTSEFEFNSKPETNLGYLHKLKNNGFLCHSALAITSDGLPLGLLWQQKWIRDRQEFGKKKERFKKSLQEKESYRWLKCLQDLDILNQSLDRPKHFLVTADRESDILELLFFKPKTNIDILVRCSHNRLLKNDKEGRGGGGEGEGGGEGGKGEKEQKSKKLFDELAKKPILGKVILTIGHSGHLPTRDITFNLRWIKVDLGGDKPISLVQASNQEQGLDWKLLTSLPVESAGDAQKIVYYYHLRWLIERFHFVLKSGCKVEELQLQESDRLFKALDLYNLVATRILLLTYLARLMPNLSCLFFFTTVEWQIIYTFVHKKPPKLKQVPNIQEVTKWLAQMGGYLPNKGSPPGAKTIWVGLKILYNLVEYENIKGRLDEGNG